LTDYGGKLRPEYFRIPQLTSTQRDTLLTPANGMLIYNTTTGRFERYESGEWRTVPVQHSDLAGILPDQHHAQLHASSHSLGGNDEISLDASQITSGILSESIGGLGKTLSPTWIDNYMLVYDASSDSFRMEARQYKLHPSFTIYKSGSTVYAIDSDGDIAYSDNSALVVFSQVEQAIRSSGGLVAIKRANYSLSDIFNILANNSTWIFEAGTQITSSSANIAMKVGSTNSRVYRINLIGYDSLLTRSTLGGTYGVYFQNAHLCSVKGFRLTRFNIAGVGFEGSWGSLIEKVEIPDNPGQYGVWLQETKTGSYVGDENNLVAIRDSWLQGSTAGLIVTDNPQKVEIVNCDLHDSNYGIILDGGFVIDCRGNYFEMNDSYDVYLRGANNAVFLTKVNDNYFGTSVAKTVIEVENAQVVEVKNNQLEASVSGTTFVAATSTPSRKQIRIIKNRFGIPAYVTVYSGDSSHLELLDNVYNGITGYAGISKLVLDNKAYLTWLDNTGTQRQCIALEGTNILTIKNFAGKGDIYINPQVSGGMVLLYDDGAGKRMAEWTKDWAWPVACLSTDPSTSGWGSGDAGKMWFNTTEGVFKYWDGSSIKTLSSS